MKKTLTVNLGGTVFNIDEDAYQLLDKYLSNLRLHFQKEEGSEEIMNDFESRIAELFRERVRLGNEVITIEHVNNMIDKMGKPEEIFGDENEGSEQRTSYASAQTETKTGKKRLMRDMDNKIIGGVASGLAAYLNWDVTAVRLLFIVLLFIPYIRGIVLAYLILWIVVPAAKTATDRLEMRGENPTVENIGRTVADGFKSGINGAEKGVEKSRTGLQKLADFFVSVVGVIMKCLAILIGVIIVPVFLFVIFILVVVIFALPIGGLGFLYNTSPIVPEFFSAAPTAAVVLGCISIVLALGIPLFSLIYLIAQKFFKAKPILKAVKWTLLILWIVSVAALIIFSLFYGYSLFPFLSDFNGITI